MSAGDLVGLASGILGILAAIVGTLTWVRKKAEKWLKANTEANTAAMNESIKQQITTAIHEALPNSPIIAETYAATRQLYNNSGSSVADKVDKAVRVGEQNSAQINALTGLVSSNTTKLSSVQTELASLNGQFLAHVGKA